MPRTTDARARAIGAAARLFQEQGYGATGLIQIIRESGAPKGSFYFYFPGGKEQLAVEAIRASGARIEAGLRHLAASAPDVETLLRQYVGHQVRSLEDSGYRRGCPIATITLEMAATSEPIRTAAAEAYDSWTTVLRERLEADGHALASAAALAQHILVATEGALLIARAHRSTQALRDAAELLVRMVSLD